MQDICGCGSGSGAVVKPLPVETGACAAVAAAMRQKKCGASVLVRMTGGELLVQYDRRHGHLCLTGPAEEICYGKFG